MKPLKGVRGRKGEVRVEEWMVVRVRRVPQARRPS